MPATPLPSASLLIIREHDGNLEVLMQERPMTMSFAAGAFVFPGGKVADADGDERWQDIIGEKVSPQTSYKIAAFRELYEETGILLGESDVSISRKATPDAFLSALHAAGHRVLLNAFIPFAHWVTPEISPKRFDTMFYLVKCPDGMDYGADSCESIKTLWVKPNETLDAWKKDDIPLMFPTRLNLMKLVRASTVEEAIEQAKFANVIEVMPCLEEIHGVRTVVIPEEAGYGVTEATQRELRAEIPPRPNKS